MAVRFDPVLFQIGQKIVQRREELKMTATELAIQSDMPMSTLSLIENGQRNMGVDKLHKIAVALKVPFSYLQPNDLDEFSEISDDFLSFNEQLKALPPDLRKMMIKMFAAQLASLK